MSEHVVTKVALEGLPDTVLFTLPFLCREMREGDTFTYKSTGGIETKYKVEVIDLRVEQYVGGHPESRDFWRQPTMKYLVSVVP